VVSDGGPQYSSDKFKKFAKKWEFEHEISSPGHSESNGCAEAHVKIAKRMMERCTQAHEDPYLGLLNLRNTPTEGTNSSPAQRLMSRRTKTTVPTTSAILQPGSHDHKCYKFSKEEKLAKSAEHYGKRKPLNPLKCGDNVRIQPIESGKSLWKQATVTTKLSGRSYDVTTDEGRTYRRNRKFLRAKPRSRTYKQNHLDDDRYGTQRPATLMSSPDSGRKTDSRSVPSSRNHEQNHRDNGQNASPNQAMVSHSDRVVSNRPPSPRVIQQGDQDAATPTETTAERGTPYRTRSGRLVKNTNRPDM